MKKLLTTFSVALVLAACGQSSDSPEADAASESSKIFDMPYLMRDLDNGLRVIVVPTDFPDIVTIQIPVQTGSRNEVEPGKDLRISSST
jgi:zinc protease